MKRELPIVQKTYDLVKWYVPILNKLPREHKFLLGDRVVTGLYDLLEGLILARYSSDKLPKLKVLNGRLDLLRHQTRLLFEFELMSAQRYKYVSQLIDGIGQELGSYNQKWCTREAQKKAYPSGREKDQTKEYTMTQDNVIAFKTPA
ncbi:MAG: diversity-generating retroelement protein Avd, partial [Leptolyngbya sp. SIO4C1]|nr:diversity-generating retroelement protein Avd [Leptolyngbya sp. SIO4C1]